MKKIKIPAIIPVPGGKKIEEFFGVVSSDTDEVSIARMTSPQGWTEPPQTPLFNEYTVVLKGTLKIETRNGVVEVHENEGVITEKNEWVQYSTPHAGGAEYIAVCVPAFTPDRVNREE